MLWPCFVSNVGLLHGGFLGRAGGVSVGIHMVSPRSWPYFTSAVAHNPFPLVLDSPSKVTLQGVPWNCRHTI